MFDEADISCIARLFGEGLTPEQVAEKVSMSLTGFRARLLNSGYRIIIRRELERIVAVEPAAEASISTVAERETVAA